MNGIDNDLLAEINIPTRQVESKIETHQHQVVVKKKSRKRSQSIEIIFRIIHYCIDGAIVFMSFGMMAYNSEAYPLVFCFGLIIWMGYRMLFFKRNQTVNYLLGFLLSVMTLTLYIWAIYETYNAPVGRILIPTVYLGYFCTWGAIRRKDKEKDGNDK